MKIFETYVVLRYWFCPINTNANLIGFLPIWSFIKTFMYWKVFFFFFSLFTSCFSSFGSGIVLIEIKQFEGSISCARGDYWGCIPLDILWRLILRLHFFRASTQYYRSIGSFTIHAFDVCIYFTFLFKTARNIIEIQAKEKCSNMLRWFNAVRSRIYKTGSGMTTSFINNPKVKKPVSY